MKPQGSESADWLRLPAAARGRRREPGGVAPPGRRRRPALLPPSPRSALLSPARRDGAPRRPAAPGRRPAADVSRRRPRPAARRSRRPGSPPVAHRRSPRDRRAPGGRPARARRRRRLRHLDARGGAPALRDELRRAGFRPRGRRQDPAGRAVSAHAAHPRRRPADGDGRPVHGPAGARRARRHAPLGVRELPEHPHGLRRQPRGTHRPLRHRAARLLPPERGARLFARHPRRRLRQGRPSRPPRAEQPGAAPAEPPPRFARLGRALADLDARPRGRAAGGGPHRGRGARLRRVRDLGVRSHGRRDRRPLVLLARVRQLRGSRQRGHAAARQPRLPGAAGQRRGGRGDDLRPRPRPPEPRVDDALGREDLPDGAARGRRRGHGSARPDRDGGRAPLHRRGARARAGHRRPGGRGHPQRQGLPRARATPARDRASERDRPQDHLDPAGRGHRRRDAGRAAPPRAVRPGQPGDDRRARQAGHHPLVRQRRAPRGQVRRGDQAGLRRPAATRARC